MKVNELLEAIGQAKINNANVTSDTDVMVGKDATKEAFSVTGITYEADEDTLYIEVED